MFAEEWPYQCPSVVPLAFHEEQAQLFGIIRPVNFVLFKSSPHGVEPSQAE